MYCKRVRIERENDKRERVCVCFYNERGEIVHLFIPDKMERERERERERVTASISNERRVIHGTLLSRRLRLSAF